MSNKLTGFLLVALSFAAFASIVGCKKQTAELPVDSATSLNEPIHSTHEFAEEQHEHITGAHGGTIIALGRDSYHVEPVFESDGRITLYMLQADESKVLEVEARPLTAFAKSTASSASIQMDFQPEPLADDTQDLTSRFVGAIPDELRNEMSIAVTIPSVRIAGERFRLSFHSSEQAAHLIAGKLENDAERELYLTPGGVYTSADIEANGNRTASQKFRGFEAAHDLHPKPGDKICPVTLTKANPKCSWIVGGESYEFCCPPCVDEFVKTAKSEPLEIKSPSEYVKQ